MHKNKRLIYGTFSTVMVLAACAVFVLVNLVAGQLNITSDLTENEIFSLSDYSKDFLAGLGEDVTLYALIPTGQTDQMMESLLDEYTAASPHIRVEKRDPVLYPAFVAEYAPAGKTVSPYSVIVESGLKSRIVPYEEMVVETLNYNTYAYDTSIEIEPLITRAIHYVTTGGTPNAYHVTGSGETALPAGLVALFEASSYKLGEANLVLNEVPEDCDMLIFTLPATDWSADEAARVLAYLQNNGRAIFAFGYARERFPNMDGVLAAFGVRTGDYIIMEADPNYFTMNRPTYLVPRITAHDITQPLLDADISTVMIEATGVEENALKRANTVIEPLFVTSASAYGKNPLTLTTYNKEDTDTEGPFNLGVAITDTVYTNADSLTAKLVVLGCGNSMLGSGSPNWDLLINSANWLHGEVSSIYIPSKRLAQTEQLQMTAQNAGLITITALIILPVLIIGIGLAVWLRRRHS
jgi:ABC-2 type transport system permease protein